jgi:hypothetical protein
MARIRANINSFSTGFISKKILGNVDLEGYNNSLSLCENFIIQHTGGCFKRGGTEFIANTKDNNEAVLIPFYFSVEESYMCEFGRRYIRFYTKYGPLMSGDGLIYELTTTFSLDDVKKAVYFQNGNIMTLIMREKVFIFSRLSQNPVQFEIFPISLTYPPLNPINYSNKTCVNITKSDTIYTVVPYNKDDSTHLPPATDAPFFYDSDKGQIFVINKTENNVDKKYIFRIQNVEQFQNGFNKLTCIWDPDLNAESDPGNITGILMEWQISQFTADRLDPEFLAVGLYEGRLFLGSENLIWGSSFAMQDILDFKLGNNSDDAVAFLITEIKSDKILWMVGQSKLFLATSSGLFMAGAATYNDAAITPDNFRVRLFESIGASSLPPISAMNTIFFVDNSNVNLHEIVLSAETGVYQANDLSLLGHDLTASGILSHTWQQTPVKTYWCAVNDGSLCSLTYLKNNGIMAWANHVISGNNVKIESLATLHYQESENIWMIVKRQINGKITRSIEYMHAIYDPLAQEEFKQFFVDSGKIKQMKHTISNISNGMHYSIKLNKDIRNEVNSPTSTELKIIFGLPNGAPVPSIGAKIYSPVFTYTPFIARNFTKNANNTFQFDLLQSFDWIRMFQITPPKATYIPYRNQQISSGKIDPDLYQNTFPPNFNADIFVKVSEIRRVSLGGTTKIFCDTSKLANRDIIIFHNCDIHSRDTAPETTIDYNSSKKYFRTDELNSESFNVQVLEEETWVSLQTDAKYSPESFGEIYKKVTDPFVLNTTSVVTGENSIITVSGKVQLSTDDEKERKGGDIYINKVSGMIEINKLRYKIKSALFNPNDNSSDVTLFDYTSSPDENNPQYLVPLDATTFSIYDLDKQDNGNLYEYFTKVDGLDHLINQTVSVCSNGNNLADRLVEEHSDGTNNWVGFILEQPSMYCVAGFPMVAKLKTVPLSGGSILGSSVGVVGQQIHAVFNLYYSLGGKYATEQDRTYDIPYQQNSTKPFNLPKNLFSGIKKLPLINPKNIYDRCIYIEHKEPLSFNLLSITQEIQVTDA